MIKKIDLIILISTFVLGCLFFYKYLFDNGFGFFNLLSYGKNSDLISTRSGELMAGDIVLGKFQSPHQNLGIVSVRFNNHQRDSDDRLVFRLKEIGEKEWYYQASYKTDQFLPGKLFPFGFPPIKDSAGKIYQFELESLFGATGSGIFLDRQNPVMTTASFFDRNEIVSNPINTTSFLTKKITNVIGDMDNFTMVAIFFSPFIFYFSYLFFTGTSYHFLGGILIFGIILDVFFVDLYSNFFYSSTALFWLLIVRRYGFESKISAMLAIFFLMATPLITVIYGNTASEKSSIWAYIFFIFSVLQRIHEIRNPNKKRNNLARVIADAFNPKFDNSRKSFKFLIKCIGPGLFVSISYMLWQIVFGIKDSINLFIEFFPTDKNIPGLAAYIFTLIILLTVSAIWIYLNKVRLKRSLIHIFIFVLVLKIAASWISSRYTNFQHHPRIFHISPVTTSEAWVDVTITGKNFQELPFVGKVSLAGEVQVENVHYWSNEKIVFRTNPVTSKTGEICVITHSKGNSNCLPFSYNFGKK